MPAIVIDPVSRTGDRVLRQPVHQWHTRLRPYTICPTLIAPVLPGETLKHASLNISARSDPLRNSLIGMWSEWMFFYVKLRDLLARDDMVDMLMDMTKDMSSHYTAAVAVYYHNSHATPDTINFTKLCLQRIVEEFFKDEGEVWDAELQDGLPKAQVGQRSWLDSTVNESAMEAVDVPTDDTGATAGELERAKQQWDFMRAVGMTDMTYEDFLKTYGVNVARLEPHKPELLRYIRKFEMPRSTIDPSSGSPTSACLWKINDSINKDRFFKEHGFIVGCTVQKPKVYRGLQKGSAAHMMDNAMAWMPAIMRDDPHTSMKNYPVGTGPLPTNTDGYWTDVRDLFIYGDQLITNTGSTDRNIVQLPTVGLEKRYVAVADINDVFVDTADLLCHVEQDGNIQLSILGTQVDQTPTVTA